MLEQELEFETNKFHLGITCCCLLELLTSAVEYIIIHVCTFISGSLAGKNRMVAALDLGGGSTQITLVPNDPVNNSYFLEHGLMFY